MLFFYFSLFAIRVLLFLQCPATANGSTSSYWVANIQRQGTVPYTGTTNQYPVYRNVQDYGAKGMFTAAFATAALNCYR